MLECLLCRSSRQLFFVTSHCMTTDNLLQTCYHYILKMCRPAYKMDLHKSATVGTVQGTSYIVTCSYLEVYGETLTDLLADSSGSASQVPISLQDHPGGGVRISGLQEIVVSRGESCLQIVPL
jgi:hypothetical protein